MQNMQQQHQAAKLIKTQRSPSAHSNQHILILKQSLTVEAHARLVQHQQQQ